MGYRVRRATARDADAIGILATELTGEIIARTGTQHFDLDTEGAAALCRRYLEDGIYNVIIAETDTFGDVLGFVAMCESHALYTEGTFGIIQEFYVSPKFRSAGMGVALLKEAEAFARSRGWRRLELCTPPLPAFGRTLTFYQRNGFEVTGGRKMKQVLV